MLNLLLVGILFCFTVSANRGNVYQIGDKAYFIGDLDAQSCRDARATCSLSFNGDLLTIQSDAEMKLVQAMVSEPRYGIPTCKDAVYNDTHLATVAEKSGLYYVGGGSELSCLVYNKSSHNTTLTPKSSGLALFICVRRASKITYSPSLGSMNLDIGSSHYWNFKIVEVTYPKCFCEKPNVTTSELTDQRINVEVILHTQCRLRLNVSKPLGECWWDSVSLRFNFTYGKTEDCSPNATCFTGRCFCNTGFVGNGKNCTDVNECLDQESNNCTENEKCDNTLGSFKCSCKPGFQRKANSCSGIMPINATTFASGIKKVQNSPSVSPPGRNRNDILASQCFLDFEGCKAQLWKILRSVNSTGRLKDAAQLMEKISTRKASNKNFTQLAVDFMAKMTGKVNSGQIQVTTGSMGSMLNVTRRIMVNWGGAQTANTLWQSTSTKRTRRQQKLVVSAISAMALRVVLDHGRSSFKFYSPIFEVKCAEVNVSEGNHLGFSPEPRESDATSPVHISFPSSITIRRRVSRSRRSTNATDDTGRVAFIFYNDSAMFYSKENVSSVIAAEVGNGKAINNLTSPVRIKHLGQVNKYGKSPPANGSLMVLETKLKCVFWDTDKSEWSTSGCCLDLRKDPVECLCNHLTSFALIVDNTHVPANMALSIVSTVGCSLSIAGCLATIIVHCVSREVRRRRPARIIILICANLMISYLIFVVGVGRTDVWWACTFVAALLHYFMLVTWCWMAVYSYDLYMNIIKVFREDASGFLRRAAAFSFLAPLIVVSISLAVTVGYLDKLPQHELCGDVVSDPLATSHYRADNMCWLTKLTLKLGFLAPVGVLLLANFVVFVLVFREIAKKAQTKNMNRTNTQMLKVAVMMCFVMGVPWLMGYVMLLSNDVIYRDITSWIFAILNTIQGLVIFLTTCVRSPELRRVWWDPLRECFCRGAAAKHSAASQAKAGNRTTNPSTMTTDAANTASL